MRDVYLMNKLTGELVPYRTVSKEFYSVPRGYLESVFDEWEDTGIIVEDSEDTPAEPITTMFVKALNI